MHHRVASNVITRGAPASSFPCSTTLPNIASSTQQEVYRPTCCPVLDTDRSNRLHIYNSHHNAMIPRFGAYLFQALLKLRYIALHGGIVACDKQFRGAAGPSNSV
jgi:hypothetical protein